MTLLKKKNIIFARKNIDRFFWLKIWPKYGVKRRRKNKVKLPINSAKDENKDKVRRRRKRTKHDSTGAQVVMNDII